GRGTGVTERGRSGHSQRCRAGQLAGAFSTAAARSAAARVARCTFISTLPLLQVQQTSRVNSYSAVALRLGLQLPPLGAVLVRPGRYLDLLSTASKLAFDLGQVAHALIGGDETDLQPTNPFELTREVLSIGLLRCSRSEAREAPGVRSPDEEGVGGSRDESI